MVFMRVGIRQVRYANLYTSILTPQGDIYAHWSGHARLMPHQ